MPKIKPQVRLNVRLTADIKRTIEAAAAQQGQTVSDFAISTLVQAARQVLHEEQVTRLTDRDRKLFIAMLDEQSTKPAKALVSAAQRYRKQVR